MNVTTRNEVIDGLRYAVEETGAGEPLVLLHGFTGCAANWRPLLPRLAERHRVIAIDLPGHGNSGAPGSVARYKMPRVAAWEAKLNAEGTPMDLEFLSVDATADDVTKFRSAHPDAPQGSRLQNLDQLSPWLASIGLDDNAVLPLQLFVNPAGELACVRMGAVSDDDYEIVKAVLNGR